MTWGRRDGAGGDRVAASGPWPAPLRLAVVGLAILLGLGGLRLLGGVGQPGPDPPVPGDPEPAPASAATAPPGSSAPPAGPPVRGQLDPDLAGTLLYFGGEHPRVADLGARTVAPVLPGPLDPPALVIRQGADPVLVDGDGVVVLPARPGGGGPRRLPGAAVRRSPPGAYQVLRGAGPDRVYRFGVERGRGRGLVLREVPLRGGAARVVAVLPRDAGPVAMLAGAVLVRAPGGALELASLPGLDRQARFGRARPLDAAGDRLAFVDQRGELHLYDAGTDADRVVRRPPEVFRWEAFPSADDACCHRQAAFSPDGRTLAVLATMDRGTLTGIVLVDTGSLATTTLDGSVGPFPTGCLPCLSWRPDGEWLFFVTAQRAVAVVGLWRRGSPSAGRIVTRLATGAAPTGLVAAGG